MDPATCPNPSGTAASLFMAGISALSLLQCNIGDPSIYPEDSSPSTVYDFIVVGAGSAGCVVANRLSAIQHWNVLLLEAGGDPPYTSEVPALSTTLQGTEVDWQYRTDGEGNYCLGMVGKQCIWPRGKVLGGSSVLNTMTYLRGHPNDFTRWVKLGNTEWGYSDMVPFFDKAEGIASTDEEGHLNLEPFDGGASTGELPLLKPLSRAAGELGSRATLEPDIFAFPGYFYTYGTIQNGTRYSTAKGYLAPIKSRSNLKVVKNAFVTKILFDDDKQARGIVYEKEGNTYTVMCSKEVIVSAGSIGSPQLLMLSGIGPKKHIGRLGIDVIADSPVGENLQDHVLFPGVVASINRGVSSPEDPTKQLIRSAVEYLLDRKGPLSGIGYLQYTGFVSLSGSRNRAYPDNQIQFISFTNGDIDSISLSTSAFGFNEEISAQYVNMVKEADTLLVVPSIIHPKSRGRLRLVSSNPRDHPKITPNYLGDPEDEEVLLGGIAESMRILKAWSLRQAARVEPRVLLRECLEEGRGVGRTGRNGNIDDSPLMTRSYWRCAMRKLSSSDYHPVGTCRMGPQPADSVVDQRLRVHSVKGLRVIDASIMPTITSGNINGVVVAIAEKGASMIIKDHKGYTTRSQDTLPIIGS